MSNIQYYYNRSDNTLYKITSEETEPEKISSAQKILVSIDSTTNDNNNSNIFDTRRPLIILDQNNVPVKIKVENVGNQSYTIVTDPTN